MFLRNLLKNKEGKETRLKALYIKEFRSYFNSVIPYVVLIAFLGASGWFFATTLFLGGQATLRGFFNLVPLLLLFLAPAITMRALAEEQRVGTIEIIGTLPFKDWEIILAKYLASLTIVAIGIAFTLIYPITVSILGNPDNGEIICSYLGALLLSAMYCAIGIFASSLSRSQIVSYVIAFIIGFFFFSIGKILDFFPTYLVNFFDYLSIDNHYNSLMRGVIDTRDIIYFLSISAFFIVMTLYTYKRSRGFRLEPSYGWLTFGIVVFLNLVSRNIFARFDLTEGKIYSLSKATKSYIRNLPDKLIIRAYISSKLPFPYNARSLYVRDLLNEYVANARGMIEYDLIDPKDPKTVMEARRAGIQPILFTEIRQGEFKRKEGYMGIVLLYKDRREIIPIIEDLRGLEYDITSKIRKLVTGKLGVLGFTKGHGEKDLDERIRGALLDHYNILDIDLTNQDIPDSVDALVILGPSEKFDSVSLRKLDDFVMSGRPVAFFIDKYNVEPQMFNARFVRTGIDTLLHAYGFKVKSGMVFDRQCQQVTIESRRGFFVITNITEYPAFVKVTDINKESPITKNIESVVLPYCAPVEGGTPLLRSSKYSWFEKNVFNVSPLRDYFMGKKRGPFVLGAVSTGKFKSAFKKGVESAENRICVFGTSKFVTGRYATVPGVALFLNVCDWLMQDEALIAIRGKGVQDRPLKPVGRGTKMAIRYINMLIPIVGLIGYGLFRLNRRKKYYELLLSEK